jgi:hypothetical protein
MRGHWDALSRGVQVGTDDYFKSLEEAIGYRTAPTSAASRTTQAVVDEPVQRRQTSQRQAIPAAPVSRDNAISLVGGATIINNRVKLTPQQMEIAVISYAPKPGETDEAFRKRAYSAYASEMVKAKSEGLFDRRGV